MQQFLQKTQDVDYMAVFTQSTAFRKRIEEMKVSVKLAGADESSRLEESSLWKLMKKELMQLLLQGWPKRVFYLHIPYKFRADHLFLLLIKHNQSKNVLFFGRCSP